MSKDFKVYWTETAITDLLSIKVYISEDSPDRAEAWILELFNSGESLIKINEMALDWLMHMQGAGKI